MVLVSTINISLPTQTCSLTCTSSGNPVETISFSSNQITLSSRAAIVVTGLEFIQLNINFALFQAAILRNFPLSIFDTVPFGNIATTENHDVGLNKWSLNISVNGIANCMDYIADVATKTINLKRRLTNTILEFPEWIYLLFQLNHYTDSTKIFLA